MSRNRVVITGIGIVSPIGNDTNTCWKNLLACQSGFSFFNKTDIPELQKKAVGLVKVEQEKLDSVFAPNKQRKSDRFIHLAVLAANEAILDAGFSQTFPENRDRFGVVLGVGVGGLETIGQSYLDFKDGGQKRISPFLIPKAISNQASALISMEWNITGHISAIVNACSSSADSVGHSFRMIRDGYADFMVTGGAESCVTPVSISAFSNMRALSNWDGEPKFACRPFDKNRSGFVMSEGAGILILENYEHAKKRGANIYAEVVGYGASADAYHITAMQPEGVGACKAINNALADAGIDKSAVGYVNAHGTGTPMNDVIETKVLKSVFGDYINPAKNNHILVSSTKSMTGHLLGAAGGLEISFSALGLQNQVVPATINLENQDPECDLDYVANSPRDHKFDYAISNSFGFGGGNAVVVLKKI